MSTQEGSLSSHCLVLVCFLACLRDRFPEEILQIECLVEGQELGVEYHTQKTETQQSDIDSSQKEGLYRG